MKSRFLILSCLAFLSVSAPLKAAVIIWGSAQNITTDSNVSLVGTLVEAVSLGNTASVALNGVTFDAYNLAGPSTGGHFNIGGFTYSGYDNGGNPALSPITTVSANYRDLLAHGDFTNSGSPHTLTISGLTLGTNYAFQWWANDSRSLFNGTINAIAGNTSALDHNVGNAQGGLGQYAIGTFTADATTQSIVFVSGTSAATQENAYQLRQLAAVPEPGRPILLMMSSAFLLLRRRRK